MRSYFLVVTLNTADPKAVDLYTVVREMPNGNVTVYEDRSEATAIDVCNDLNRYGHV